MICLSVATIASIALVVADHGDAIYTPGQRARQAGRSCAAPPQRRRLPRSVAVGRSDLVDARHNARRVPDSGGRCRVAAVPGRQRPRPAWVFAPSAVLAMSPMEVGGAHRDVSGAAGLALASSNGPSSRVSASKGVRSCLIRARMIAPSRAAMTTTARSSERSRGTPRSTRLLERGSSQPSNARRRTSRSFSLVAAVSAAAATRGQPAENCSSVSSRRHVSTMETSRALGVLDVSSPRDRSTRRADTSPDHSKASETISSLPPGVTWDGDQATDHPRPRRRRGARIPAL